MAAQYNKWLQYAKDCRASTNRLMAQAIWEQESEETKTRLSGRLTYDNPTERVVRTWFFSLSMKERQQLFIKPSDAESPPSDRKLRSRLPMIYAWQYSPDSAELRARHSEAIINSNRARHGEIMIKPQAWTGESSAHIAQARRYDNALKAWNPYRLPSSGSPMYKTFDKELSTVVDELWFCRMEGCNAAGVKSPGGIKQHVRDHHSDSLDTYDVNLDVSPTVREDQNRP